MEIKGYYKHLLKEIDSVQYDSIEKLLSEFELKLYEDYHQSDYINHNDDKTYPVLI